MAFREKICAFLLEKLGTKGGVVWPKLGRQLVLSAILDGVRSRKTAIPSSKKQPADRAASGNAKAKKKDRK